MKSMCPDCSGIGTDCDKCKGEGEISVTFKEGDMYTAKCESCGFKNGGCISDYGNKPSSDDLGDCVQCGSGNMSWEFVIGI